MSLHSDSIDRGCCNRRKSKTLIFAGGNRSEKVYYSVFSYQSSWIKLGTVNEPIIRVAVYVSLMTLYFLRGSKVKVGELSFFIWAAFVGYTFTLTFAVQALVNNLGDLRDSLAAVERINYVLFGVGIDEALAHGLEGELKQKRSG
ncbi:hypothetical protein L6164_030001 [Bauhinia variegata]|uniref:Uncharacterized protein n=1 Tax=Bauhinia variegata TaxID=167791 RepID=A0ACB9LCB3_BAUVA|nr:hypothetical protein L6164_030001 [Bauhinia variegata]